MTRHDPAVRLRHMLDHAREAVALLGNRGEADVATDRVLELPSSGSSRSWAKRRHKSRLPCATPARIPHDVKPPACGTC